MGGAGGVERRGGNRRDNLTASVENGTQPAEQWKIVVRTNDPQPDHYSPDRNDGHKAPFVEIDSLEAHEC